MYNIQNMLINYADQLCFREAFWSTVGYILAQYGQGKASKDKCGFWLYGDSVTLTPVLIKDEPFQGLHN